jgi:spore coat protein U-like protein
MDGLSYGGNTADLTVTVNIKGSCNITNSPLLDFGALDPDGFIGMATTAELWFKCTSGTQYRVGLDNGRNHNGSYRCMKHETASDTIGYYLDPCPDGKASGNGEYCHITGTIPSGFIQGKSRGKYTDTVIVTLTAID